MARPDLLALTPDDLATLTNRGIVKRAAQEVQTMAAVCVENDAGDVAVNWPDEGVDCVIPGKGGVPAATCTCPSTTLCRHVVRSVFAYQRAQIAPATDSSDTSETSDPPDSSDINASQPWDPGTITDEQIAEVVARTTVSKARKLFDSGQVVEVVRSPKPAARIHSLSTNVRFLVPGDLRYTYCDCAETQPCTHVPLAVWAFRLLDKGAHSGVVSTHRESMAIPVDILDDIDHAARELVASGFSNLSPAEVVRWRRLETRLRSAELTWPAEIVAELVTLHEAYIGSDSQFVAGRIPELIGELLVRADAIRNDTGAIPQLFIRGSASDKTVEIGSARLIGLGCGVHIRRRSVRLAAYMQDIDSGITVAVTRQRSDPAPGSADPIRTFAEIAQSPVVKGSNLHNLGYGQILIKGGKRTASCEFLPRRAPVVYSPQGYRWELLRPPLFAEDFDELRGRLEAQPPASLMPRRLGANLSVCAIDAVEGVHFDSAEQTLNAVLLDRAGQGARLRFPYFQRNAGGFERLAAYLINSLPFREGTGVGSDSLPSREGTGVGRQPKFISGEFRVTPSGLEVDPVAIIFEKDGVREMVQPWIDAPSTSPTASLAADPPSTSPPTPTSPIAAVLDDVAEQLSTAFLVGLTRLDAAGSRPWRDIEARASGIGLSRLSTIAGRIAESIDAKRRTLEWSAETLAHEIVDAAAVTRIALDLVA